MTYGHAPAARIHALPCMLNVNMALFIASRKTIKMQFSECYL